jgi:hypothetical protein
LYDRAKEELGILSSECDQYVNWNCLQLKIIHRAFKKVPRRSLVDDILMERGAKSAQSLRSLMNLVGTVEYFKDQKVAGAPIEEVEGNLSVIPANCSGDCESKSWPR